MWYVSTQRNMWHKRYMLFARLRIVYSNKLARIVLNELEYLHHNGFRTSVTDALRLSQTYGVENFDMDCNSLKKTLQGIGAEKMYLIMEMWS